LVLVAAGCSDDTSTPTSSTPTTTTPSVAAATIAEEFTGTVRVGSAAFYSFSTSLNGTITVTLTSVGGVNVPSTAWMGIGIGIPNAEDCAVSTSANTPPGASAQLTGTFSPGVYCARIYDIGNLAAPATFAITIAHPE
jgi:hypothetical protein